MILSSMFTRGNLKNKCYTEQSLLGVPVRHHLREKKDNLLDISFADRLAVGDAIIIYINQSNWCKGMPLMWNTIPKSYDFKKKKKGRGKPIQIYLQNSEVFKNAIHHVLFRQMFEFVDKVDHVFAHRWAVDPINAFSSFQAGILRLRDTQSTAMP